MLTSLLCFRNMYLSQCQNLCDPMGCSPLHAHGDLTSLAPHERLPEILVVPREKTPTGVSGVSSSCGARGGFLPRHDEDLREPLVRRQGSQVSMRV